MRRKERECHEPAFFDHVFNTAEKLVLCLNDGDFPYCVPLNFARDDGRIYIHCALGGHKLELIRKDGHAAFNLVCEAVIDRPASTTYYKSVCGRAMASIVENTGEKRKALALLADRYKAACKDPVPDSDVNRVAIIRLDILEMTGKRNLPRDHDSDEVA